MARVAWKSVARQLESLFEGGAVAGLSDRQLLERFTAGRDAGAEAAFAALVRRHGPMVLHVCRQLLGDWHQAEDAFQAVFLVLARKARSVRNPDLLGNWLYGVARRTARKAKVRLARRRRHEEEDAMSGPGASAPAEPAAPPADQPAMAREQAEALHAEIERLPKSFRLPIVLCYFEGLTVDEAARQLRWPAGTLRSRLARARDKLRRGPTRRGIVLPAAAIAAGLSPRAASAMVSSPLCDATTKAAMRFAAGPAAAGAASASVTTLAQEVLRAMLLQKLKLATLIILFLGAVATGAGYLTHSLAMKDEPVKAPAVQQSHLAAKSDRPDRGPVPSPGRMIVTGRVLDPDGKPAAGVPVAIIGRPRKPWAAGDERAERRVLLGRGRTGADGQFQIDAARSSSAGFFEVYAIAAAFGFGLGWAALNPDAEQPAAEIRLQPEQAIRGKLVDIHGQPAAGVELRIWSIGRPTDIGTFDGVNMGNPPPPEGLRVWPRPIVTDDQGQFTLNGIGRKVTVGFHVHDRRFAFGFRVQTDDRDGPKTVTEALQPAKVVAGRALAADTGRPIAGTVVNGVRADDQGRFTANPKLAPIPRRSIYRIEAFPPEGAPYLASTEEFEWTKGAVKMAMDIKLPRGVLIRGKVTEQGTGRPLGGASVQYIPTRNRDNLISGWQAVVASKEDGSYQIAVQPGKGYLFIYGPTPDYILESIGERTIYSGQPGGQRLCSRHHFLRRQGR